jgi:N6-L-threonylcarbamoyladenine synthase
MIAIAKSIDDIEVLAHTVDDACGEAFDKGATSLGFSYPGARQLDGRANSGRMIFEYRTSFYQDKTICNFSFSGHKSALRRFLELNKDSHSLEDMCFSYREVLVEEVCDKVRRVREYFPQTRDMPWTLSGGVAANGYLREKLKKIVPDLLVPRPEYCTDNGAMIAFLGLLKFRQNSFSDLMIDASPS